MPGPNSVNLNRPVQAGGYNPNQPGAAQAPNLKDFALTIDDFRQFASGKYNAGAAPGTRAGVQRTWERLESPKIRPSEAASIRLAFAFALEDAGVSGARLASVCKRLGLEADFSFSKEEATVYTALTREEVKDIIAQSLGDRFGQVEPRKAEEPDLLKNVNIGPLLPEDGEVRIMEEPTKEEPPKIAQPKVEPPKEEPPKVEPPKVELPKVAPPKVEPTKVQPQKVEAGKRKQVGGAELPKITSQEEFVTFFKSLTVTSKFGSVSEDDAALDANGEERKTFTYQGLVFRGATRSPDHPSLAEGFKGQNDLSVPKHRTEAMGLGAKADNGTVGGWGATGKSGVSTGKTIDGAIAYRGGGSTLYVIDTTKIPKGEKAWDMESTVYENGYKERRNPEDDETNGEVNISTVPRNAIVGWLKISPSVHIEEISDNAEKLAILQNNPDCLIEFNPDYKA